MRERLNSNPNDVIVKHLIEGRLFGNIDPDFREMSRVNRAHAIMLAETGILPRKVVSIILAGLARLDARGSEALVLNPDLEELYFNIEHALVEEVGADAGGRLHTARSRNDLYAAVLRMKARGYSLRMSHLLVDLIEAVIACQRP